MAFRIGDRVELTPEGMVALCAEVRWRRPPKGTVTWLSSDGQHVGVAIGRAKYARAYSAAWWRALNATEVRR